jgi:hypothetical protein
MPCEIGNRTHDLDDRRSDRSERRAPQFKGVANLV